MRYMIDQAILWILSTLSYLSNPIAIFQSSLMRFAFLSSEIVYLGWPIIYRSKNRLNTFWSPSDTSHRSMSFSPLFHYRSASLGACANHSSLPLVFPTEIGAVHTTDAPSV